MHRLIKAFFSSLAAFRFGWKNETALRHEIILIIMALPIAIFLSSSPWKFLALWGSLLVVLAMEFLNTGIEKLADRITMKDDELIGMAKDCGSAGVLVVCLLAASLWIIAFFEMLLSEIFRM